MFPHGATAKASVQTHNHVFILHYFRGSHIRKPQTNTPIPQHIPLRVFYADLRQSFHISRIQLDEMTIRGDSRRINALG